MRTTGIKAALCRIPLPRPIVLGPVRITTRDIVAVRVLAEDGSHGDAIAYPRGMPLLETVKSLSRSFLDVDPHFRAGAVDAVLQGFVNTRPVYIRAAGLFEIALTDLACKAADLPLFKMLGAVRDKLPLMAVAGYFMHERSVDDIAGEVERRVDEGYARVKIMLHGADPHFDADLVQACARRAGGRLAVDAHWSWRSIPEAMRTIKRIDDAGLLFLEDPFGAGQNHLIPRLQGQMKTRLAAGEDMPDVDSLFALTDTVTSLRVDATTCGGITAAQSVTAAARMRGVEVLPHVFLPVHAHLGCASPAVAVGEIIPEDTGADPLHLLYARQLKVVDAMVHLTDDPGAGFALDWTQVEKYAAETFAADLDK
jgi:L-alanine-DL-glutamate epimerase-like enolase superfamily enzyme